ncbi:hypothetical protein NIES4073_68000 [Kalymmatonema gypsitolerans NIES-4073]|nr:hypothetical protein NIES4073_68000 [Scytonema sp. NIES-4073]
MATNLDSGIQLAYAQTFVSMLRVNPYLQQGWSKVLTEAKQLPQSERLAKVNSFLHEQGYDTTVDVVQDVLKQPIDQSELPNGDAILFAVQALTDGKLLNEFIDATSQTIRTDNSIDVTPVNNLLAQKNVKASALQVANALASTAGQNIAAWTNTYGDTTISRDGSGESSGPTLIVTTNWVSLDKHRIVGWHFDDKTATLSWTTNNSMNATSASLQFSKHKASAENSYDGNEFYGMLDLPNDTTYKLKGKVDFIGHVAPPKQKPPSVTLDDITKYAIPIIGSVIAVGSFILLIFKGVQEYKKLGLEREKLELEIKKARLELEKAQNAVQVVRDQQGNAESLNLLNVNQNFRSFAQQIRQIRAEPSQDLIDIGQQRAIEWADENLVRDNQRLAEEGQQQSWEEVRNFFVFS